MKLSIGFVFLLAAIPALFAWQNDPKCGIKPPPSQNFARIINGQDAEPHEFPWIVSIIMKGDSFPYCAGSIINKRWILTAAHCALSPVSAYRIVAAAHNISDPKAQIVRHVVKHVINPNYYEQKNVNDTLLLKLDQDLPLDDLTAHVGPICLPKPNQELDRLAGTTCTAIGWGWTYPIVHGEVDNRVITDPLILQKVNLTIWKNEDCATAFKWGGYSKVTEQMICANLYEKGACHGDSGGPMVAYENGHWYQLGIVSWGHPECGFPYLPSVFVRVSAFIDWIDQTIAAD